ncbi:hypothetical protein MCOR24_003138 [Pyricularia oryzae]|nr:hypothetical protein MCOR24_003138 [Pyricularia oryzae]KAI6570578.1 hypothetical protein MCOR09_004659 [Pyricularia oryzae]
MSTVKRRNSSDQDGSAPPKKQRRDRHTKGGQPDVDETYGQRYVFANLDDPTAPSSDEEFEVEDEGDALAYLRSVRDEASVIPHLLSAPKAGPQLPPKPQGKQDASCDDDHVNDDTADSPMDRSIYHDGFGDTRGYYHDGAYTAMPDVRDDQNDANGEDITPEEAEEEARKVEVCKALYGSIISRFKSMRAIVHQEPPDDALLELSSDHGFEVNPFGSSKGGQKSYTTWSWRLRNTDPQPAQIAAMDRTAAFRLIRVILSDIRMLKRGHDITERTSAWLWALLAKLPDAGELDYTDVGVVRDLGKRAVLMMTSLAQMTALREQVELGQHDRHDEDAGSNDAAPFNDGEVEHYEGEEEMNGATRDNSGAITDDVGNAATNGDDGAAVPDQSALDAEAASDDEPMDLEDGEVDEGEVPDDTSRADDGSGDLEAIRARLLGDLEPPVNIEPEIEPSEHDDWEAAKLRSRMNMRMTLNMILTVAGEFYGQRDLLEFRDPFRGM